MLAAWIRAYTNDLVLKVSNGWQFLEGANCCVSGGYTQVCLAMLLMIVYKSPPMIRMYQKHAICSLKAVTQILVRV